jgi:hypothetical protein
MDSLGWTWLQDGGNSRSGVLKLKKNQTKEKNVQVKRIGLATNCHFSCSVEAIVTGYCRL